MRGSAEASSLAAEAYAVVRRRIVRGRVSLGEVVSRRKIAAELGMSFLPVSMALLRLESEGLLESRPRAGTRVRIPSPDDVCGHYMVREALEVQAAKLFAEVATPRERADLQQLAARVDGAESGADRMAFVLIHQKLHRRIAECTRCRALSATIERTNVLATMWLCAARQFSPADPRRRHQDLTDVLAHGTVGEAADAMRQHIAHGLQVSLKALEPYFRLRKVKGRTFSRGRTSVALLDLPDFHIAGDVK